MGKEEIDAIVERAVNRLVEAEVLLREEMWGGSVNRSYYAVFCMIQAMLNSRDIHVKTHKGAHIKFHEIFIKTNLLDETLGPIPDQVEEMRIGSDYDFEHPVLEGEAVKAFQLSQQFLTEAKKYLDAQYQSH